MDRDAFDALTRKLAGTPTRRTTLRALLGVGLAGAVGSTEAARKKTRGKNKKRKNRTGRGSVNAEATCASPGPSSNLNKCNFNDAEFAGIDLSSSSMKETKFRRADLTGADLSSSNLKNADFRQADLTCANLRSSACGGANFNNATFCRTRTCNGAISDRDCPDDADLETLCCDCGPTEVCNDGQCQAANVCLLPGACQYSSVRDAVLDPNGPSVLRVAAGTYPGRFNTERTMTIIGAGSGPGGTALVPAPGDTTALIGVGIGFDLTLQDLAITGNSLGGAGGGMRIFDGSTVTLTRVLIASNTASQGGGIFNDGDLTLEAGTTITNNTATNEAGGIYNIGNVTLLPGSDVSGNTNGDCVNGTGGVGCP